MRLWFSPKLTNNEVSKILRVLGQNMAVAPPLRQHRVILIGPIMIWWKGSAYGINPRIAPDEDDDYSSSGRSPGNV